MSLQAVNTVPQMRHPLPLRRNTSVSRSSSALPRLYGLLVLITLALMGLVPPVCAYPEDLQRERVNKSYTYVMYGVEWHKTILADLRIISFGLEEDIPRGVRLVSIYTEEENILIAGMLRTYAESTVNYSNYNPAAITGSFPEDLTMHERSSQYIYAPKAILRVSAVSDCKLFNPSCCPLYWVTDEVPPGITTAEVPQDNFFWNNSKPMNGFFNNFTDAYVAATDCSNKDGSNEFPNGIGVDKQGEWRFVLKVSAVNLLEYEITDYLGGQTPGEGTAAAKDEASVVAFKKVLAHGASAALGDDPAEVLRHSKGKGAQSAGPAIKFVNPVISGVVCIAMVVLLLALLATMYYASYRPRKKRLAAYALMLPTALDDSGDDSSRTMSSAPSPSSSPCSSFAASQKTAVRGRRGRRASSAADDSRRQQHGSAYLDSADSSRSTSPLRQKTSPSTVCTSSQSQAITHSPSPLLFRVPSQALSGTSESDGLSRQGSLQRIGSSSSLRVVSQSPVVPMQHNASFPNHPHPQQQRSIHSPVPVPPEYLARGYSPAHVVAGSQGPTQNGQPSPSATTMRMGGWPTAGPLPTLPQRPNPPQQRQLANGFTSSPSRGSSVTSRNNSFRAACAVPSADDEDTGPVAIPSSILVKTSSFRRGSGTQQQQNTARCTISLPEAPATQLLPSYSPTARASIKSGPSSSVINADEPVKAVVADSGGTSTHLSMGTVHGATVDKGLSAFNNPLKDRSSFKRWGTA